MNEPLRVLIIADSDDDVSLVDRELRQRGFDLTCSRVGTADSLPESLNHDKWDVIIAEQTAHLDPIEAISILKQSGLDIPFIVLSAQADQEKVVKAVEAGACDYILRENLRRLAAAVERELKQTESRRTSQNIEEISQEREGKFRYLAEQFPNMIFINFQGKVVYANKKCEEVMGYTREEFYTPDFDFLTLIAPEYHDKVMANYRAHIKGDNVAPYDYAIITKGGERIESIITTTLIDYAGEKAILGVVTDVTERKRVVAALRESEEKYSTLVEQAKDAVVLVQDERVIFVNSATEEIFGYSLEDLSGRNFLDFVAPEDKETLAEIYALRFQGKDAPSFYEAKIICKDGTVKEAEISGVIIQYQGKPADMGIVRDITERKRTEEALRESEAKYADLVERAMDGVTIVQNERVVFANDALKKITGYTFEEMNSRPFIEMVAPECREDVAETYKSRMNGEAAPSVYEIKIICKDGTVKEVEISAAAGRYNGEPADLAIVRDVTERKQAQQKLRQNMSELECFNRMAVGRELRMIELKQEVNQLLAELGRQEKYQIAENCDINESMVDKSLVGD